MTRKDCDSPNNAGRSLNRRRLVLIALLVGAVSGPALAGTVRLWPSASVVDDTVKLSDLCELTGFDLEIEQALTDLSIADAPPTGGRRLIHIDMIRAAIAASGANMATLALHGATQCTVSRPSVPPRGSNRRSNLPALNTAPPTSAQNTALLPTGVRPEAETNHAATLRQAIIDYFDTEFERYHGKSQVIFDRVSEHVLGLSGPEYRFRIQHRRGSPLGLTSIEVDILTDDRVVQTVPMVVQVSMMRKVVAARRSVNQGATVRTSDVHLVPMTVTRLDKLGHDNLAMVVGQRAKRYLPVGTLIEPEMLEAVPLVQRGELVSLASVVGGIRITTTGKAAETGLLGDVIKVRAANDRRVEYDATVVGPGQVEIAAAAAFRNAEQLAIRGPSS